jgi:hypothetical protein
MNHKGSDLRQILILAVFLIVGAPMVLYVWMVLGDVLSGDVEPVPALIASALSVVLVVLVFWMARVVSRMTDGHAPSGGTGSEGGVHD